MIPKKHQIIAIDGHSSCGKSTVSKQIAKKLNFAYIDTGAMYRAVTLYFIENQVDIKVEKAIQNALKNINIHFEIIDGNNTTFLNNVNVELSIRTEAVSSYVSEVAAISSVRKSMVSLQRKAAENRSTILDGRDIGTVVFPNADVKLFLTATLEVRAKRRLDELLEKGEITTLEEVSKNLQLRDQIDSTRKDSPLQQASDAIIIDNTDLTKDEQFAQILSVIEQSISTTGL